MKVTVLRYKRYELLPGYEWPSTTAVKVKVVQSQAKAVKGHLSAIAICRLESPFTHEDMSVEAEPTLEYPRSSIVSRYGLHVKILDIWFYDSATGEVFAKASEIPPERPPQPPPLPSRFSVKIQPTPVGAAAKVKIAVDGKPFFEGIIFSQKWVDSAEKEVVITTLTSPTMDVRGVEVFGYRGRYTQHLPSVGGWNQTATVTITGDTIVAADSASK